MSSASIGRRFANSSTSRTDANVALEGCPVSRQMQHRRRLARAQKPAEPSQPCGDESGDIVAPFEIKPWPCGASAAQ